MNLKEFTSSHPLPIVCGILAVGFLAGGVWRSMATVDLQEQVTTTDSDDARLAQNILHAQKLDAHFEQISAINQKIQSRLTNPSNVAENQQYFYKLEAETGVKIMDLRQSGTQSKKGTSPSSYSTVVYTITVDGEYPKVIAFVRKLESGDRIVRVTSANIMLSKNTTSGYHATPPVSLTAEFQFLGVL